MPGVFFANYFRNIATLCHIPKALLGAGFGNRASRKIFEKTIDNETNSLYIRIRKKRKGRNKDADDKKV